MSEYLSERPASATADLDLVLHRRGRQRHFDRRGSGEIAYAPPRFSDESGYPIERRLTLTARMLRALGGK